MQPSSQMRDNVQSIFLIDSAYRLMENDKVIVDGFGENHLEDLKFSYGYLSTVGPVKQISTEPFIIQRKYEVLDLDSKKRKYFVIECKDNDCLKVNRAKDSDNEGALFLKWVNPMGTDTFFDHSNSIRSFTIDACNHFAVRAHWPNLTIWGSDRFEQHFDIDFGPKAAVSKVSFSNNCKYVCISFAWTEYHQTETGDLYQKIRQHVIVLDIHREERIFSKSFDNLRFAKVSDDGSQLLFFRRTGQLGQYLISRYSILEDREEYVGRGVAAVFR